MQSLKKSVLPAMLALFGALLFSAPAHAQNSVSVDVPFDFVVGKAVLRAGHYRIAKNGAAFVSLVDVNRNSSFSMLLPSGDVRGHTEAYLLFTRYGQQAFLNKVVFSPSQAYDLPLSSGEKEMRAQLRSGEEMAVLIQPMR